MTALNVDFLGYSGISLQSDDFNGHKPCNFIQYAASYLDKYKKAKCYSSIRLSIKHFMRFQGSCNEVYNTDEMGKELLDEFADFMHVEEGLKIGTVKGLVQRIKYLLKKAQAKGYKVDESYTDVRIRNEDLSFIYLSKRDISRIYYFDGLTKRQKQLRDIFILGCMTGLRFSDYSRLTKDNIKGDNIQMLTQKTKVKVCIPITKYVREIFEKYNNILPKACKIQYFNKVLKEILRKVGMTEIITLEREIAGEIVTIKIPKYELATSHMARRTFITNMIKDNVSENRLKGFTGHKSSECLSRYNRMTLEENARSLAGNGYLE